MSVFASGQRPGRATPKEARGEALGLVWEWVCEMSEEVVVPIAVTEVELCCFQHSEPLWIPRHFRAMMRMYRDRDEVSR